MIVIKENERLYLRSWEYNAARTITELAAIVKKNGGRVEPCYAAIISNRTLTAAVMEQVEHVDQMEKTGINAEAIAAARVKLEQLQAVNNEPITVTHTSYISFVLDGFYYYYQVDENPFFDFHYQKTRLHGKEYSRDAVLKDDPKIWVKDCFFSFRCPQKEIEEAAAQIFKLLTRARESGIRRSRRGKRVRVENRYNSGYHYKSVEEPERFCTVDF